MEKNLQKNSPKISRRLATSSGNFSHFPSFRFFLADQRPLAPFLLASAIISHANHSSKKKHTDRLMCVFLCFFACIHFTLLSFLCQYISHENYFSIIHVVRHYIVILYNENPVFNLFSDFFSIEYPYFLFISYS